MSSMCGMVDFEKRCVDFSTLREMGRAMVLRGQDQSGAYLRGGIGLYHNRMLGGEGEAARQPYTAFRNGHGYTVMVDGELAGSRTKGGRFSLFDFSSSAEAILEAYLNFGLDFAPYVQGSFAFAICDEYRGEMLLGRSADGKCPLYYSYVDGRLMFASEIKGMVRGLGGTLWVREDALQRHLLAPCGALDATELYEAIDEIPAGCCVVFSRLDHHTFPLPYDEGEETEASEGELLIPSSAPPSEECLDCALMAFDYPQFDVHMPAYLQTLASARQKNMRTIRVLDGARRDDMRYAKRREDRLGGVYGLRVSGVTPPEEKRSGRAWKDTERWLEERLAACDTRLLARLYGGDALEAVSRERSIERRIRMLGILCQSERWLARYPVMTASLASV